MQTRWRRWPHGKATSANGAVPTDSRQTGQSTADAADRSGRGRLLPPPTLPPPSDTGGRRRRERGNPAVVRGRGSWGITDDDDRAWAECRRTILAPRELVRSFRSDETSPKNSTSIVPSGCGIFVFLKCLCRCGGPGLDGGRGCPDAMLVPVWEEGGEVGERPVPSGGGLELTAPGGGWGGVGWGGEGGSDRIAPPPGGFGSRPVPLYWNWMIRPLSRTVWSWGAGAAADR